MHETFNLIIIGLVVLGVFVAFLREWAGADLVAMAALGVLVLSGILTTPEVLAAFSNHAPITIAAMFVLSAALERTGAIDAMGHMFSRVAGKSELRVLFTLMLLTATVSAFVNNTPVVVVFMPIVLGLSRSTGVKASRMLIPLSFSAMLGGTCTLIGTSTNLVVDGIARQHGQPPFGMFEFTKLGAVYAFVGITYLLTLGRFLLPQRETLSALINPSEIKEFLTQAVISKNSPLVGHKLSETPLAKMREVRIIEVLRNGARLRTPLNELIFEQGDQLLLKTITAGSQRHPGNRGNRFSAAGSARPGQCPDPFGRPHGGNHRPAIEHGRAHPSAIELPAKIRRAHSGGPSPGPESAGEI